MWNLIGNGHFCALYSHFLLCLYVCVRILFHVASWRKGTPAYLTLPHTQIANSTDALCATQFTQQTPFTRYLPSTPLIRFSCVCVIMYVFMCVCVCVCVCMCVRVWKGEAKKMCNSIYSTACLVPRLAPYLHRSLPLLLEIELPCPFPQAALRPSSKRANLTVFGRNRTRACFCWFFTLWTSHLFPQKPFYADKLNLCPQFFNFHKKCSHLSFCVWLQLKHFPANKVLTMEFQFPFKDLVPG